MSPATITNWLRTILFLPPESSSVAQGIDHLHMFVILTTMVGSAGVGAMAVGFLVRYRHRGEDLAKGRAADTQKETPASVEWGIALGLFALFFAWWVIGFCQYVRVRVAPPATYDIYVTGKQWMWKFAYPDGHHTISKLYVPTGRPVKLILTSRDVIHSFFVPDFRLKQDVIPGRYTTLWFTVPEPGRHDILCAEYCGTEHSTMRAEVVALDGEEFGRWLARGDASTETTPPYRVSPQSPIALGPSRPLSLVRLGEEVAAQQGCLRCHTLDGTPHIGPTFAGLYGATVPLEGGGSVVADEAYLTESMMDPLARRHAGFQTVMPSYLGRLEPAEVAALVALIKSLADVRGQEPAQSALPPPEGATMPAGRMGVPPAQLAGTPPSGGASPGAPSEPPQPSLRGRPPLQPVPRAPDEPNPASQGLPPPGAPVMPRPAGSVTVGPNGVGGEER